MEYICYKGDDELYHWGIKGMRWGIRRFQNKDGSLTAAGRKRRAKLEGELEKLGGKNGTKSDAEAAPRPKTVSEMSDAELRDKVNRLQNERMYYELNKQISALNPRPVSKGEKFMNGLMNDVVAPAAKNAGRAWLEKFMKDKLGLNQEDSVARLEKQVKKLELNKRINDLKKGNEPDELKDLETKYKKLDWEKKISDLENPKTDGVDLSKALEAYRNTSEEERQALKEAASMYENIDKIRKKGKTDD